MCSAEDTRNSPGASTLTMRATPSSAYRGKALGAHAHAEGTCVHFQPQRARELAVAVGQHQQAFGCVLALAPGLHHERVVDRHAGHLDALGAELVEMLDEAGQVLLGTGRCERRSEEQTSELQSLMSIPYA